MKNRLLHLLGKVLLLSLLATACHKETAQPDPAPDKLNYELYENVCTDLSTYVKTYEEKEYDALIRYAEAIPGVDSTQVIDSILYVYTQGGYEWFYDMYGLSAVAPADYSIDPAQLQAELDSLCIAWGDSIITEENFSAPVSPDKASDNLSRSITSNSVGSSDVILKRKNILYWNPWPDYNGEKIHLFPELLHLYEKKFGITCTIKTEATPDVIRSFGNYDLVLIRTHGTKATNGPNGLSAENGLLSVPISTNAFQDFLSKRQASFGVIQYTYDGEYIGAKKEGIGLSKAVFDNLLPDLGNTIIWTCMCHSTHSGFFEATMDKNVPVFFGANQLCDITGPYECLKRFLPKFYLGASARDAFNGEADYRASRYKSYVYDYPKGSLLGYSFSGYGTRNDRIYCWGVKPKSWSDHLNDFIDCVKAYFRAPVEKITNKDYETGIYLMNTETNEADYIAFTENNTTISDYKEYDKMVASGTLNIAVPTLKPKSSYKYWTYLKDDDGITLSDNFCTFTTPSNNFIQMQYQVVAKELTRICTSADAFLGDSKFKIIGVDYGEGTGLEKFEISHWFKTSGLHTVRIYYDGQMTGFRDFGSDDYPLSPFYECSALGSITIPKGVTTIGEGAFGNCHNLNSITIPNSVTRIGKRAFQKCHALSSITIPENVTKIEGQTFYYCTALISITIPRNVTEIAGWAFYSCKALTSVTIQEGVTRIGEMAFGDCRALTSVTIPQSVMKIGQWAFSNDQLTVKCLPTSPPSPSSPAPFILKKLYVPASSVDSYKKAWEGAYKDIIFPL